VSTEAGLGDGAWVAFGRGDRLADCRVSHQSATQACGEQSSPAEDRLYVADMNLGYRLLDGNFARARELLDAHRHHKPDRRASIGVIFGSEPAVISNTICSVTPIPSGKSSGRQTVRCSPATAWIEG
jgi:hypothetical protein